MRNPYLRLFVKPMTGVMVTLDLHRLDVAEEKGAWKDVTGVLLGRDATGQSGHHIGDEIDFVVSFPIKERLRTLIGVSHFRPGDFGKSVRGKDSEDFAYLQLTLAF